MTRSTVEPSSWQTPDAARVTQAVTVIMGVVVGLTFLFGFGNVLNLALRLGVPVWVAPLIAPAVDLSILGLLVGTRHLAVHGATSDQLRPARRLLMFTSLTTLALNIADPLLTSAYGKAAFDAVGPLLLIGWAEVGPGLLQAINAISQHTKEIIRAKERDVRADTHVPAASVAPPTTTAHNEVLMSDTGRGPIAIASDSDLIDRARHEDAHHWATYQRPISAETLRKNLRISAARSRMLVSIIRAERSGDRHAPIAAAGQSRSE